MNEAQDARTWKALWHFDGPQEEAVAALRGFLDTLPWHRGMVDCRVTTEPGDAGRWLATVWAPHGAGAA